MTSGRLLVGVDIMTGFNCNDSLSLPCMQTKSNTNAHAHTDTAVGTLSDETVFAKITLTCGINPKRQHQFH